MPGRAAPEFVVDEKNPHLGGYIRGGDPATYFPDLWRWLVEEWGVQSVIDVGCGEGHAVKFFRDELGIRAHGIDGLRQRDPDITQHDFSKGPLRMIPGGFYDLAWSCEFVEHVEERYIRHFLRVFRECRWVLLTHADPGQRGHHHVNCRPADYWVGVLAAAGFRYDEVSTLQARGVAALNRNKDNHFVRSGLAFRRET